MSIYSKNGVRIGCLGSIHQYSKVVGTVFKAVASDSE